MQTSETETNNPHAHEPEGTAANTPSAGLTITDMSWQDPDRMPPSDLPEDDSDRMSPWHFKNTVLLMAGYLAANNNEMKNYYMGANMFFYYSIQQIETLDFKGPDFFIVFNVDGTKPRQYWATWDEDVLYPKIIIELLSPSTAEHHMRERKLLYEETFHVYEHFYVGPDVEELLGWQAGMGFRYHPIEPDGRGWLWSNGMRLWLGPWEGFFLGEYHTWLRLYHPDGQLVLLPEEAERQRADAAEQALAAERQRTAELLETIEQMKAQMQ
ncbi:MAG: Uma2 family endonuclease [Chloroflexaceae bacterium]|nr:Uma2 family endonuclease [Chloroflexaceae bacterium]